MNIGTLTVTLGVNTEALNVATARMEEFTKKTNTVNQRIRTIGYLTSAVVTAPMVAAGKAAFDMAKDYEYSMQKIVGLTGTSQKIVDKWGTSIKAMAREFGKSPQEVGDALYFIASSGIAASDALDVLKVSVKAASAGLGDTAHIADYLTSVLNAYRGTGVTAAYATDVLVAAVREGKAEASGFAAAMGGVIPIAAQLGVSIDQVAGAMAAITLTGSTAAQSGVYLKNIFNALYKEASKGQKAMTSASLALTGMNTSYADLRKILKDQGIIGLIEKIRTLTSQYGETLVAQVFPEIRAMTGMLSLMGKNFAYNTSIMKEITEASGSLALAFDAVAQTVKIRYDRAIQSVNVSLIELGQSIGTALIPLLERFAKWVDKVVDNFNELTEEQKRFRLVILASIAASGPFLLLVSSLGYGLTGLVSIGKNTIKVFATLTRGMGLAAISAAAAETALTGTAAAGTAATAAATGAGAAAAAAGISASTAATAFLAFGAAMAAYGLGVWLVVENAMKPLIEKIKAMRDEYKATMELVKGTDVQMDLDTSIASKRWDIDKLSKESLEALKIDIQQRIALEREDLENAKLVNEEKLKATQEYQDKLAAIKKKQKDWEWTKKELAYSPIDLKNAFYAYQETLQNMEKERDDYIKDSMKMAEYDKIASESTIKYYEKVAQEVEDALQKITGPIEQAAKELETLQNQIEEVNTAFFDLMIGEASIIKMSKLLGGAYDDVSEKTQLYKSILQRLVEIETKAGHSIPQVTKKINELVKKLAELQQVKLSRDLQNIAGLGAIFGNTFSANAEAAEVLRQALIDFNTSVRGTSGAFSAMGIQGKALQNILDGLTTRWKNYMIAAATEDTEKTLGFLKAQHAAFKTIDSEMAILSAEIQGYQKQMEVLYDTNKHESDEWVNTANKIKETQIALQSLQNEAKIAPLEAMVSTFGRFEDKINLVNAQMNAAKDRMELLVEQGKQFTKEYYDAADSWIYFKSELASLQDSAILSFAKDMFEAFRDSNHLVDLLNARIEVLTNKMKDLAELKLDGWEDEFKKIAEQVDALSMQISTISVFENAFTDLFTISRDKFENFGEWILDWLTSLGENLSRVLAEFVAKKLVGVIFKGLADEGQDVAELLASISLGRAKSYEALAIAVAEAAKMGYPALLATIPSAAATVVAALGSGAASTSAISKTTVATKGFKEGGVVPPGYPNDTFPAMLTSGEIILPPDKAAEFADQIVNKKKKEKEAALKIPKMQHGGVVPTGYPNDTFPAWLSSGETVLPKTTGIDQLIVSIDGLTKVMSRSSEEYKTLYESGRLMGHDPKTGYYTAKPLQEVVVVANKDKTWADYLATQYAEANKDRTWADANILGGMFEPIMAAFQIPQLMMMQALTGEAQLPSEALKWKGLKGLGADILMDPLNVPIAGPGRLAKNIAQGRLFVPRTPLVRPRNLTSWNEFLWNQTSKANMSFEAFHSRLAGSFNQHYREFDNLSARYSVFDRFRQGKWDPAEIGFEPKNKYLSFPEFNKKFGGLIQERYREGNLPFYSSQYENLDDVIALYWNSYISENTQVNEILARYNKIMANRIAAGKEASSKFTLYTDDPPNYAYFGRPQWEEHHAPSAISAAEEMKKAKIDYFQKRKEKEGSKITYEEALELFKQSRFPKSPFTPPPARRRGLSVDDAMLWNPRQTERNIPYDAFIYRFSENLPIQQEYEDLLDLWRDFSKGRIEMLHNTNKTPFITFRDFNKRLGGLYAEQYAKKGEEFNLGEFILRWQNYLAGDAQENAIIRRYNDIMDLRDAFDKITVHPRIPLVGQQEPFSIINILKPLPRSHARLRQMRGEGGIANLTGLTKESIASRFAPEQRQALAAMSDVDFGKTVLTPKNELKELDPDNTFVVKQVKGIIGHKNLLIDALEMSRDDYVKEFNNNINLLNEIIAKYNKTGKEYKALELTSRGVLKWGWLDEASKETKTATWAVGINPARWTGEVRDILNPTYFQAIPGLSIENSAQSVFDTPTRGTASYKSLNEYLKTIGLGRVKPGFNTQTKYSRSLWENAIRSGRAIGYYNDPATLWGSMKTIAPIAATAGGLALSTSQASARDFKKAEEKYPEVFKIIDTRKVDAITGKPVSERAKIESELDFTFVEEVVRKALERGIDPYTALAIPIQEKGRYASQTADPYNTVNVEPHQLIAIYADEIGGSLDVLRDKLKVAERLDLNTFAKAVQTFNGLGKITQSTFGGAKAYGIDIPEEGISMRQDPLYGRRIEDIRNNILLQNEELVAFIQGIMKDYAQPTLPAGLYPEKAAPIYEQPIAADTATAMQNASMALQQLIDKLGLLDTTIQSTGNATAAATTATDKYNSAAIAGAQGISSIVSTAVQGGDVGKAAIGSLAGLLPALLMLIPGIGPILAMLGGGLLGGLFSGLAAKMARGGVVPWGYPNDSFPAMLSSGEIVLPKEYRDMPDMLTHLTKQGYIPSGTISDELQLLLSTYEIDFPEEKFKSLIAPLAKQPRYPVERGFDTRRKVTSRIYNVNNYTNNLTKITREQVAKNNAFTKQFGKVAKSVPDQSLRYFKGFTKQIGKATKNVPDQSLNYFKGFTKQIAKIKAPAIPALKQSKDKAGMQYVQLARALKESKGKATTPRVIPTGNDRMLDKFLKLKRTNDKSLQYLTKISRGTAMTEKLLASAKYYPSVARMASGGQVPAGYPNDSFPAMLTSGEYVLPKNVQRNLRNIEQRPQKVQIVVDGKISGRDLVLALRRSQVTN